MKRHLFAALLCTFFIAAGASAVEELPNFGQGKILGGKNPAFDGDGGHALGWVMPMDRVPKRIAFDPGKITLVADPSDRRGDYIVVYLINDTDSPVARAVGENVDPKSQVKIGGFWLRDGELAYDCGTVDPPVDLPAKHALAIGAWCANKGNLPCERRYSFTVGEENIVSNSFLGICRRERIEDNFYDIAVEETQITSDPQGKEWWMRGGAQTMEEFVAVLELARCHSQFTRLRGELVDQLRNASENTPELDPEAREGIAAALGKPWFFNNDKSSLVARCTMALQLPLTTTYGAPEKFPTLIWKHLTAQSLDPRTNEWHIGCNPPTKEQMRVLVMLARSTIERSTETEEIKAAAGFLASRSLEESQVSTQTFRDFLSSGKKELIEAGLRGLVHRGLKDDAGEWLANHFDQAEEILLKYQSLFLPDSRVPKAWEMKIIGRALEIDPLKLLGRSELRVRAVPPDQIPEAWKSTLRKFLQQQFTPQNLALWKERSDASRRELEKYYELDFSGLDSALKFVNLWKDPQDDALFQSYFKFPAAVFNSSTRGTVSKNFTARSTAADCLKSRKLNAPPDLVTGELVILSESEPYYLNLAKEWMLKWPWVAPFLAGIIFMAVLRRLFKKRVVKLTRAHMVPANS